MVMEELKLWPDDRDGSITMPGGASLMQWIEQLEYLTQLEPLPRLMTEMVTELAGIRKALEALAAK